MWAFFYISLPVENMVILLGLAPAYETCSRISQLIDPVLVSSIYAVETCPKSAEGGELFWGLGPRIYGV